MSFVVDTRRRCRRTRPAAYQLTVAVVLIAFGALLFLDNIGVLHIQRIYEYWPVVVIAFGGAKLIYRPSLTGAVWSLFLIGVGSLFLLVNLDIFRIRHDSTWPLSLLFITFGFLALVKTLDRRSLTLRHAEVPNSSLDSGVAVNADVLNESVTLGGIERRVESIKFQGGELHSVLGSIEVDLSRAQLPPGWPSITLFIECVLANMEIRIPDIWRVSVQAHTVLGNIENKTIAPRMNPGDEPPTLIITGSCVLGNVELRN